MYINVYKTPESRSGLTQSSSVSLWNFSASAIYTHIYIYTHLYIYICM